ncbi:hypothetical protein HON36_02835 [Candidatus Parcubacteria bacterium]|jgi:hypothetical protein|nr:hypothetical protein [Candidatus Parcubacteria bacterium]MBT7228558.1 hypothetical protein [Candidatus Parcubacteria bacterium]
MQGPVWIIRDVFLARAIAIRTEKGLSLDPKVIRQEIDEEFHRVMNHVPECLREDPKQDTLS